MAKQIKATDVFESEDIFKGIRESAEQAIATLGKFKKELAGTADDLKKTIGGASMGDTKGINELIAATNKANDVKEKTIKIDQEQERLRKLAAQAEKEEIRVKKEALTLAEKEQRAKDKELKQAQQQESIYAQQSKRLNELRRAYKDLAFQNKENTAEAQKLISEITDLDTKLKKVDATVGQHQRNVGNYEGATMSLRTELRKLTQELANLDSSDPRFAQMAQRAGELRDQMQDAQGVIQATAGSAVENLAGSMVKAGQVGVAAFQGIQSAMVLAGVENENLLRTMAQLQAVAGLADALQVLGGLGDTLTQIKAGFVAAAQKLGILITVKETDVVVTEAQTAATVGYEVATEGAEVATTGLGTSMKALPIIAIIAGIASLVAIVYSYISSSNDAAAATKKREEAERRANEETKKASEYVAKESTEFVGLIMQLKSTNAGSKERSNLMNQINSQYGTTLKNLKDETAFQAQLNQAVADYIEYAKAKFKMQQYEEAINRNLTLQQKATINYNKELSKLNKELLTSADAKNAYNKALKQGIIDTQFLNKTYSDVNIQQTFEYKRMVELKNIHDEYNNTITDAKKRLENYGLETLKLKDVTGKYNVVSKESNDTEDKKEKLIRKTTEALERTIETRDKLMNPEEVQKMMLLDEERAVQIADLAVLEAEIALKRAENTGNTKQIQAAEKALFDARKKQIEEQLKLQLAQTDDVNEQERLRKEAQLKIMNLQKEETKDLQKQAEIRNSWAKYTADYFIEQSNRKIAQIDKEIAAAENQQNILQELAANGNINAKESLAEQQKIIDQANRRKEQEQRRQQMIELISGVYQTYNSKVAEGAEHPLMETIRDTVMLQQFANTLLGQMPAFLEGTEDTGTNGYGVDGKGGFHAILHPNERVVPKSLNEQIGSMSNEQLARLAQEYQNGKLIRGSQAGSSMELALLANKLDTLTDTIKQKPETNIELGEITSSVMEIVKSTKQGNTLKTNRYKIRK